MSRPPRPHHQNPPTHGALVVERGRLQMQPLTAQDLLAIQRQLASDELGLASPGGEGDFSETLFELSALVAHVLGKHQDFYASEAYLGTASVTQSLIRHGWRLAYVTDPGLSATGTAAITVPPGLVGELPAGLALSSAPVGERKAQKYETLAPRRVDSSWNAIEPEQAHVGRSYAGDELTLVGVGHRLEIGEHVALVERDDPSKAELHRIELVREDLDEDTTHVRLVGSLTGTIDDPAAWTLYAHPRDQQRLFGSDADPVVFPPEQLASAGAYPEPPIGFNADTPPQYGYRPIDLDPGDVFTAARLDEALAGQWLLIWKDAELELVRAVDQYDVELSFHAWQVVAHETHVANIVYTLVDAIERWLAASTTALTLVRPDGTSVTRAELGPGARLRHGFELALSLVTERSNLALHEPGQALVLAGRLALEPGMRVLLSDRAVVRVQLVELTSVELGETTTTLGYAQVGPSVGAWPLGDLIVLGNVVPVSHGSSRTEVLGDSDGVTPLQRFVLRKPRVTQLPGPGGAEPSLELQVGEVTWTRVVDFEQSQPSDRHYRVEIAADQRLHVIFGDGRRGAIPPRGRRHIVAVYRVDLGVEGNLEANALTRLAQRHPLVAAIRNPLPLVGGTEPADASAVKREATRWIRTFDRAVSTRDHADLALLFPGVARANASLRPAGGVLLVVADAEGSPIADLEPLAEFMRARRDASVPLEIVGPEPVPIRVVASLEIDRAFNPIAVELAVRTALHGEIEGAPGWFTFPARELGQAAHRSELYAQLQAIPGVVFVHVEVFQIFDPDLKHDLHDTIVVRPYQWLSLAPAQLSLNTSFTTEAQ